MATKDKVNRGKTERFVKEAVDHLMSLVTTTGALRLATESVVRKIVLAYKATREDTYITVTGDPKKKTAKQKAMESKQYDTLATVLADWPDQPFGMTTFAVLANVKAAYDVATLPEPEPAPAS